MKRFLSLGLFSLAILTGCFQITVVKESESISSSQLTFTTNYVQQGEVTSVPSQIEVENKVGDIEVHGADVTTVSWSWELRVRASDEGAAQEAIHTATCQTTTEGNALRVAVAFPVSGKKFICGSNLKLTVPKSVSVKTHTTYGATRVADLNGNVEAHDQSGSIKIRSIQGNVQAETSYDSMEVANVGPSVLKNRSGSINASKVKGSLDAETSYDSLRAEVIDGNVKLRNQSGAISASDIQGNVDIKTSYDSLRVKNVSGTALLKNQSGSINAEQITGAVKADTSYDKLRIDSSGKEISCHNNSGSIEIHARSPELTNLEAKTSYDSLHVSVARTLKPAVTASTSYAEVHSDFPLLAKRDGKDPFAEVPSSVSRVKLQNQSGEIGVTRD